MYDIFDNYNRMAADAEYLSAIESYQQEISTLTKERDEARALAEELLEAVITGCYQPYEDQDEDFDMPTIPWRD